MTTKQVFFFAAILYASLCYAQGNIVYYGAETNALNVVFADAGLSVSNQTLIVADLNQCLNTGWGREAILYFRNKEDTIGYLFTESGVFYDPFPRDIVATPNGHALHISEEVSDAYTASFAFFATNANITATGYAFVEFLNSTNFPAIPATDWPNYYLSRYKTDAELIALAPHHIPAFARTPYYPSWKSFS